MRKLIVAGVAFALLLGGFIVYMEIDKRKFIDSISAVSAVVDQPVNGAETIEGTQGNKKPKFQEVDTDELLAAVNRIPEQFGYSEASTTYAKLEAKKMSGEKLTNDEKVALLEATLYLWPNEYTRKTLILEKWLQSKGPSYDHIHSDEAIAELKELGISVAYSGDAIMISTGPDMTREEVEEAPEEYKHIYRDFLSRGEPSDPASDTVFSEGIDEDTDLLPARSEGTPITPESQVSGTPEHIHQEEGHLHETPAIQPLTPANAKSVEDSAGEGLSKVQQELVKQFFDEYGTKEGLRLLREMDPDTARRFERERREPPVPSESGEEPSAR